MAEALSAFSNRSFRKLFTGVLILYVLVGSETALVLYIYEFFWSLNSGEITLLYLVYPMGLIAGPLFTTRLHELWEKSPILILGTVGWSFCQFFPIVGRLLDVVPENGTTALIVFLIMVRFLQGALIQQGYASFSSMMGDIADEHELATGRRQEGIFFGVVSFSGKAASGPGIFYGPLSAVFAVIRPFAYRGYALDREHHRSILKALQSRADGVQWPPV